VGTRAQGQTIGLPGVVVEDAAIQFAVAFLYDYPHAIDAAVNDAAILFRLDIEEELGCIAWR
jgi:hypothetical protein